MRALILTIFLLPYVYFGLRDNFHHFRQRSVGWTERLLHLTIVFSLFTVIPHAYLGHQPIMLTGLLLFVSARSLDEFVFHRGLSGEESDLHAKTHFAFLMFVVAIMAVDWLASPGSHSLEVSSDNS